MCGDFVEQCKGVSAFQETTATKDTLAVHFLRDLEGAVLGFELHPVSGPQIKSISVGKPVSDMSEKG